MSSGAILCVTPNPAVDRTLEVSGLLPGAIQRAASGRAAAGGKGVNVARALAALGPKARCLGPLGGANGRLLADLAAAEGLEAKWTWCDVETRSCLILVDAAEHRVTVINEPGPPLSAEDWRRVGADVLALAPEAAAVCVSGSLPPGVASDGLAALCRALVEAGQSPWVDSSGAALAGALSVAGVRLKINREEAEEALGVTLKDAASCAAAARRLVERGMSAAVLTLGADGAVAAAEAGCWHAEAPPVESASAVASGDSFLAGLVAALAAGHALPEALRWGTAAGAANALAGGGARFSREQFDSLLSRVRARPL
jgi:1-phosphofructokinase